MPRGYRDEDDDDKYEDNGLGQDIGEVTAIRDTGLSLKCKWADGTTHFIAKSQIHDDSEVYNVGENNKGILIVTPWLARKLEFWNTPLT